MKKIIYTFILLVMLGASSFLFMMDKEEKPSAITIKKLVKKNPNNEIIKTENFNEEPLIIKPINKDYIPKKELIKKNQSSKDEDLVNRNYLESLWENETTDEALKKSLEIINEGDPMINGVVYMVICDNYKNGDNKQIIHNFIFDYIVYDEFHPMLSSCVVEEEPNLEQRLSNLDRLLQIDHKGGGASFSSYANAFLFDSDEIKSQVYDKIKNSSAYQLEMTVNTYGKVENHEEIIDKELREVLFNEPSGFGSTGPTE